MNKESTYIAFIQAILNATDKGFTVQVKQEIPASSSVGNYLIIINETGNHFHLYTWQGTRAIVAATNWLNRRVALKELVEQAQELNMGYE